MLLPTQSSCFKYCCVPSASMVAVPRPVHTDTSRSLSKCSCGCAWSSILPAVSQLIGLLFGPSSGFPCNMVDDITDYAKQLGLVGCEQYWTAADSCLQGCCDQIGGLGGSWAEATVGSSQQALIVAHSANKPLAANSLFCHKVCLSW